MIRNDVSATIDVGAARLVKATGGSITVAAVSTTEQIMNGANRLDLATSGILASSLDNGSTFGLVAAFGSAAPLTGTVSLFTIAAGSRWQVVTDQGAAYLIERDGSHLYVRRASITAYTLAASVSAGLVGIAASGASSTNLYSTGTRAAVTGAGTVEAFSRIDVSASDTGSVTSYLPSVSFAIGVGAAAVAVSVTRNIIQSAVDAYLGAVTLKPCTGKVTNAACTGSAVPDPLTDGGISAIATSVLVVHGATLVVAVGVGIGFSTAVSYARSYAGGTVRAHTGATTVDGPAALMTLRSNSTVYGSAVMQTGAGNVGVAVASSDGKVLIRDTTEAFVGDGAQLTLRALTVDAERTGTARGSMTSGAGAAIAITAGGATTEESGQVNAYIGPADGATPGGTPTTIVASGKIAVTSRSSEFATATGGGGSGGAITVTVLEVEAKSLGSTRAYVGDTVKITSAGGLSVDAEIAGSGAHTTLSFSSGAAIDIKTVRVTSRSTPHVSAWIGDAVVVGDLTLPASPVGIAGDVVVSATGRAEADATGQAFGGGVIAVGVPHATVEVDPDVSAFIGRAGASTPTIVITAGSVKVRAELTRAGAVVPDDTIQSVDVTGETLTFHYPGIGTGSSIVYSAASPAGGLRSGSVYTVLDAGTNLIRLGSMFEVSGVDPLKETITFATPHPFQSGDCVYYDPRGGTAILAPWATAEASGGSCANTTAGTSDYVFFVRKVDDVTIKLTTSSALATAALDAPYTVTVFDGSHLQLGSIPSGLVVNTGIAYRAPVATTFVSGFVDVTLVAGYIPPDFINLKVLPQTGVCPGPECGSTIHTDSANNIFVGHDVWNSLATGQAVRYVVRTGTALAPLTNGGTYYVIKGSDGLIQLADSYCHAVGTAGDSVNCPATINVTPLGLSIITKSGSDGTTTNGLAAFTSPTGNFVAADVGKSIRIQGGIYRIASVTSTTAITLDRAAAATTTTAAWAVYSDLDEHSLERSIAGLEDGRTYYVTNVDTGNSRIQVSATRGGPAISTLSDANRPGPHAIGFATVDLVLGVSVVVSAGTDTLTATAHGFVNADPVHDQVFVLASSVPGGLAFKTPYYVVQTTANTLKLSRTLNGPAIDITSAGLDVRLVRTANLQAFFVNLTSAGSGTQRLLAPSGATLASIAPPPGDGVSTATAQGGLGGVGEFTFPDATLSGSPSVAATIAAGRIDAGADIRLDAASAFEVLATADTAGGGVISVGKAVSSADMGDAPTTATVAPGTRLTAGGDVSILAFNDHKLRSTATALGGGLAGGKIGYTHAAVDNDVNVVVGTGVSIVALGAVAIAVDSKTTASTDSYTIAGGAGAGADADNTNSSTRGVRIGTSGDTAQRGITIGGGAQISGNTVDILASVSLLDVSAKALAWAFAVFVASAFSDAYVDVYSDAFVKVENATSARTTITGARGVDVEARHRGDLTIKRNADSIAVAIIFPQENHVRGTDSLVDTVNVARGALVVVGARANDPGVAVTVNASTNKLTAAGHGLEDGDRVVVSATTVPGGLTAAKRYYVVGATASDFQLSTTYGGTPIDLTSAGAGVKVVLDRLAATTDVDNLRLSLYGAAQTGAVTREHELNSRLSTHDDTSAPRSGRILWDANVIVLGGLNGSPLLVVDAAGKAVAVNAVKVVNNAGAAVTPIVGQPVPLDAGGGITVADITNSGYADIALRADNDVANEDYTGTKGDPNQPWPTFEFRDTLAQVVIVDYSSLALRIGKIDVVNDLPLAQPARPDQVGGRGLQDEDDDRVRP